MSENGKAAVEFDLDRYLRNSKKIDLSGIDWDSIPDHHLADGDVMCMHYMMDIEAHTVVYLRDLLATRATADPQITAFLSCWVYEELWHGEAFSRFLGEAGYRLGLDREEVWSDSPYPTRSERNSWIRRRIGAKGYASHLGTLIGSALFKDFPALHMTWGAVNELSTLSGYHRLIAGTKHPILVDLLQRIIKDERRHFAFYRSQAGLRLARSERARRVTRWAMEHLWAPVGTGVRPQWETDFVVVRLFGDPEGREAAAEMDRTIARLPGFGGARLYQDALEDALLRSSAARRPGRAVTPFAAFRA